MKAELRCSEVRYVRADLWVEKDAGGNEAPESPKGHIDVPKKVSKGGRERDVRRGSRIGGHHWCGGERVRHGVDIRSGEFLRGRHFLRG